jgi:hypothetical protein
LRSGWRGSLDRYRGCLWCRRGARYKFVWLRGWECSRGCDGLLSGQRSCSLEVEPISATLTELSSCSIRRAARRTWQSCFANRRCQGDRFSATAAKFRSNAHRHATRGAAVIHASHSAHRQMQIPAKALSWAGSSRRYPSAFPARSTRGTGSQAPLQGSQS